MKFNITNLKKKRVYSLCALMTIFAVGFTGCSSSKKNVKKQDFSMETNKQENINNNENIKDEIKQVKPNKQQKPLGKDLTSESKEISDIKFIRKKINEKTEPKFSTSWKKSSKVSACIEGKGPDAEEEGVGEIYIKNLKNKEMWSLNLFQKQQKDTPKYIEWFDDNNLMVIIGNAHGTVSQGGNLYKLDINTGETTEIYNTKDKKKQVLSVKRHGDKLNLNILVYENDELLDSHKESKTIYIK
ncbi:hypothetical protein Z959_07155 [Clostridium novyi B str. ATCC 27606]|uniref:DUF4652 domain-containing protein n=2 Tax=Clostridium TaxID=1485 RepID=A0AA40IVT3_CLONO|nr:MULTISPECIES: DUF4652 domain-containing protein [Clostridium]KEI11729.1 hypothetical protein Z958_08775 [Clostridium novyi B str. NCTC 9691]KEI17401.1 hypothetical protein Z959_07155 [Clostridium novyi B str. ATCC 27606]KEI18519.1 hypothetical protein Z960_02870 [Clostridium haemolyticum NCTC 9693]KGN03874.1 hypothetical protein Z961_05965 [Clostridium haemolyticum NCTC 8350]OOB75214.1 hypothetical protein AXF41_01550 [Clostridium haemolyticum]